MFKLDKDMNVVLPNFVVHLTILSAAQIILHRIMGWIVNWKGCGKDIIYVEGLRETSEYCSPYSRSQGRNLNPIFVI